jgi:hypothetical protein
MMRLKHGLLVIVALSLVAAIAFNSHGDAGASPLPQGAEPPDRVVRLIFIHHSTGENWLADDNGGLGRALAENNYFVSDTNYGWGPDSIGDRTDIPDWIEWFRGPETERYMEALFTESDPNSAYTRSLEDPGGVNEIVLFKSCFPNSNLEGNPDDPPAEEGGYSVGGAKFVYNQLLEYFGTRPDKLFVAITAPPVSDPSYAKNARAFNNWLVEAWLNENHYPYANVAVFDFYNVLTGRGHHHRYVDGGVEHSYIPGRNTTAYASDDDHPSRAGNLKATEEFVPLLNVYFHRWQSGEGVAALPPAVTLAREPKIEGQSEAQPTTQQVPVMAIVFLVGTLCAAAIAVAIAAVVLIRRRHLAAEKHRPSGPR